MRPTMSERARTDGGGGVHGIRHLTMEERRNQERMIHSCVRLSFLTARATVLNRRKGRRCVMNDTEAVAVLVRRRFAEREYFQQ